MRVFFAIRDFFLTLNEKQETRLPLTPYTTSVVTEDIVDTSMIIIFNKQYSTCITCVYSTVQYSTCSV